MGEVGQVGGQFGVHRRGGARPRSQSKRAAKAATRSAGIHYSNAIMPVFADMPAECIWVNVDVTLTTPRGRPLDSGFAFKH